MAISEVKNTMRQADPHHGHGGHDAHHGHGAHAAPATPQGGY
jgi:hypothetical protein